MQEGRVAEPMVNGKTAYINTWDLSNSQKPTEGKKTDSSSRTQTAATRSGLSFGEYFLIA